MLFGVLIIILVLQMILFLTGVVCNKRISDTNRTLGKVLGYIYIADSFVMIAFAIIFAIYVFSQKSAFFMEGGKHIYYILVVGLILGNVSKLIVEYFESFGNTKENSFRDNVCFGVYIISVLIIVVSVYTIFTNGVTYIPDENRKLVEEYEYTDIELSKTITSDNKEDFFIVMIDRNNIENVLLINTNHVSSSKSQCKYVEKYEVKEITEDCFGGKKENTYYEYKVYTPDEVERNWISLYCDYSNKK